MERRGARIGIRHGVERQREIREIYSRTLLNRRSRPEAVGRTDCVHYISRLIDRKLGTSVVCSATNDAGGGMARNSEVTIEFLQAFADSWNRHDVDSLMEFMTEDCVFEASGGPDVCGARYEGQRAVREAFAAVWRSFPDAQWRGARHFIARHRGVSEWMFTGIDKEGHKLEVNGCDVFTFRDGKILVKNSYRKNRLPTN